MRTRKFSELTKFNKRRLITMIYDLVDAARSPGSYTVTLRHHDDDAVARMDETIQAHYYNGLNYRHDRLRIMAHVRRENTILVAFDFHYTMVDLPIGCIQG